MIARSNAHFLQRAALIRLEPSLRPDEISLLDAFDTHRRLMRPIELEDWRRYYNRRAPAWRGRAKTTDYVAQPTGAPSLRRLPVD